ncbi:conserved hypothetical protein [Nitrosococcus halophilus Nc 4]|uniref:Uncharacterized protein n=1 Tax=Nitrosococcus halophilus (strain Nc4) TaxID=472759 RepID=D5BWD5_NITHN|nr:DUF4105 domain-containing protein [Nitrosococcus halophilus]ADE15592.1 conserved hypothetical protein [Nitrosococcus halophilus Nc 4]
MLRYFGLLCLLNSICSWAQAEIPTLTELLSAAQQQHLSERPQWWALLHYRPTVLGWSHKSQADDPSFFLAQEGKTNPDAELAATLIALREGDGQATHPQCRFPARFYWLQQQGRPFSDIPPVSCPEFEAWLHDLNTATVTLVFASSYLNSPSSMFGHTFLRLDPSHLNQDNLILASTVSYAADAGVHDSEIMFAYRGIFGGYPGITTVEPYFDKIRLYSKLENRDLWEYQLNLSPDEVTQLLRHAWEIKDKRFDYFFFDENCAYRILALIDVARPGTELISQVSFLRAIPADTVRLVVANQLVDSVYFRPSQATELRHHLRQLSPSERNLAFSIHENHQLPDGEAIEALTPDRHAAVLETAYELVRYRTQSDKLPREVAADISYELLRARSKIPESSGLLAPPMPAVRDDQGHDTARITAIAGRYGQRDYLHLAFRPAYHDFSDPAPGYRPGSQLQFLNTELRYYLKNGELELEQLNIVDIISLSPRDRFFHPISWQAGFGADRQLTRDGSRPLAAYVKGGAGVSYGMAHGLAYALATGTGRVGSQLAEGYQASPGITLGWNLQQHWGSIHAEAQSQFYPGQDEEPYYRGSVSLDLYRPPGWSLTFNIAREKSGDFYATTIQGGVRVYF